MPFATPILCRHFHADAIFADADFHDTFFAIEMLISLRHYAIAFVSARRAYARNALSRDANAINGSLCYCCSAERRVRNAAMSR